MSDDSLKTLAQRFFRTCLCILGGVLALWLAIQFAAQIWAWLLLGLAVVAAVGVAVWLLHRRYDRW